MNQFVPAADWSGKMGGAPYPYFAPSCDEGAGLVDLPWRGGHAVMRRLAVSCNPPMPESAVVVHEHEAAAPWLEYPVIDDVHGRGEAPKDLFSEIFGEMRAAAGWDTAGNSTPPPLPRAGTAVDAMSGHDASTTVKLLGKRERSDTSRSPSEAMLGVEESESAAATTRKRRRDAQDHNRSERRRRDRINEKMRALQELVPHCNKTDKVSMLDESIEYLKSLQVQVQVMWTMGGGMAPVMFPASGAHQYMRRIASRMPPFRT